MRFSKYAYITVFVCVSSISYGQEENRDTKQHPELSKLVRNWAQKLGGELWHFGELVTRKTKVKDSFKDTTVIVEDGDALLRNIHENISNMMKQKIETVKRIAHEAEESAQDEKESKVTEDFQFYNAKNLTNSLDNTTTEDTTKEIDIEAQELRYSYNRLSQQYQAMVQPEEIDGYQQDQDQNSPEDTSTKDEKSEEPPEVSDGSKRDPQARETKKQDKFKLPLYRNRHFYNIPVNTNYSAVHVPSNVYERSMDVIFGIYWSEKLDHFFKTNYNSDPTLSWQYFCSSTGFMRQFPAMIWSQEPIDLFDCRTRSWYIEAAASPKDVVILVDRSGSMTGMRREIARHVVHNILDTLGNNDYVNIYTFSNTTDPLVECFDKKLVQATLANVRVLKESMSNFKTEQIANFSLALITAFELLQDYRESGKGANCSQAIMLVTDGVQYNYKEIFQKYNWGALPDHMTVNARVFTYLIGREVSDVRDVKWMACANQGYYVHLSTYAEVREEVLHYIPVMARPMVLSAPKKPKATWSPVYADVTDPKLTNWLWKNRERNRQRERFLGFSKLKHLLPSDTVDKKFVHQQKSKQDNYGDTQTYHLMTSVSLPVYDKRPLQERVANLLGVAGLDVPIEYIQRLMMPYQLGVNGYAFLVTNNGYILTHPDLRPVFQGILKPSYNGVDMIEVEILDDDSEPRMFDDVVKEFRKRVIMQESGNITLKIKSHLDDMKRIILMTRHYFYKGIEDTPFSLVIALPHKYGFNRIEYPVENDIHRMRSIYKIEGSLTQFFTGNWTIHPDWHYCRYLDDREYFENPEEEFLHFLRKMEGPGWKWTKECDRKLMCKVVADAKITSWFNQNITTATKEENGPMSILMALIPRAELVKKIGIVVAFMATHSGLTRWQNFPQNIENPEDEPNFRILHNKAIDEIWYKRAVEHYYVDPSNFVYSVPHESGNATGTLVTVSHAIFKEEGSKKASVAVVGYQFYHSALQSLFTKITSSCGDIACKRTCESEELHCVLLDDNGFVIISDHLQQTGKFFGNIRPDIMSRLVDEGIYKITRMYDYQGLCPAGQDTPSPATKFGTPFAVLLHVLDWTYHMLAWAFFPSTCALEEKYRLFHEHLREKNKYAPCDREIHVYSLNYDTCTIDRSRFSTQLVRNGNVNFSSNLLLLVFDDSVSPSINESSYTLRYQEYATIEYSTSLECLLAGQDFYRKCYGDCFNKVVINPAIHLSNILSWAVGTLLYFAQTVLGSHFESFSSDPGIYDHHSRDHMYDEEHQFENEHMTQDDEIVDTPYGEKDFIQRYVIPKTKPEPCDYITWLYSLVHYTDRNISNSAYNKTMIMDCSRPYIVQKVSGSNMILLVINNACREDENRKAPLPEPMQIDYNMSLACYRVLNNDFPRRLYMSCMKSNSNESEIKLCGKATHISPVPVIPIVFVYSIFHAFL